jgi:hypothetical protein
MFAQTTVDLTVLDVQVTNLPAGTTVSWHTATPATGANEITTGNTLTDVTAVPVGATYYMAFKDATNACYSPTLAVPVLTNSCLIPTADLTTLSGSETNNPGSGVTLTFHTARPVSTGNLVSTPATVSEGIYYAAFFDSVNNCYSDNVTPVMVVTSACAEVMITQVYHSSTLGNAIEVTNIDESLTVPANALKISYFNSLGDKTDVSPTASYTITGALQPGQSALVTSSGFTGANIIQSPVQETNAGITNFAGGDDIIIISTSTSSTAFENRLDIIESFTDNTSFVRSDEVTTANTTFTASEWVAFVDDNLDPYRVIGLGGPERHPHDPLISEVNTANTEANLGLGLHRFGATTRISAAWDNGYPDRSRRVFVEEDYSHTGATLSARQLTLDNNSKLSITDNLLAVTEQVTLTNTNDEIRLIGDSQLITTHTNSTQILGNGKLLVDQNSEIPSLYRYNYIGSPVNTIGTSTYTFASVIKDGTTPTSESSDLRDITFISGNNYDGATTDPITLADYWMYTYGSEAAWTQKRSTGIIPQTDGVIFKGPGRPQNYTFVGTPKDGILQTTVAPSTSYLLGNPYASAISVKRFIEDNLSSTTGTLYFWEHQESINGDGAQNAHNFGGYIGGYAIRNISMGLAANNPANDANNNNGIAGVGEGVYKEPGAYIPIAQGFFVGGSPTGGTIEFNNSQREYIVEGNNSVFFRHAVNSENDDEPTPNNLPIIKLGMDYLGEEEIPLHRQIGISFSPNNSFAFDKGYDAGAFDLGTTDIYWDFPEDDTPYFIAGVQEINSDLWIPLTIIMDYSGEITLTIDEWQHINREVYLLDLIAGMPYHIPYLISEGSVTLNLPAGIHKDRFVLDFGSESSLSTEETLFGKGFQIYVDQEQNELVLKTNQDLNLKDLVIYDLVGKEVMKWNESQPLNKAEPMRLKMRRNPQGIYLVKVRTDKGILNTKIYLAPK